MKKAFLFLFPLVVSLSCTNGIDNPPANVTNLLATNGNGQSVLTWTDPSDGDIAYVEMTPVPSDASSPVIPAFKVNKGVGTATVTGLSNGITYGYIAKAVDAAGNKSSGVFAYAKAGFRVLYYGNGNLRGTVPVDATIYSPNDTVTVAANLLERIPAEGTAEAYINRNKWNTSPSGTGTTYSGATTFAITDDVRLYSYWEPFVVTDTGPAGGYIFYDKGSFSDGWRYMETAPHDAVVKLKWGGYGTLVGVEHTTAENSAIGAGKTNTARIVSALGAGTGYAAGYCDALSVSNDSTAFTDWFLPSMDELDAIGRNLYWSNAGNTGKWSSADGRYYEGGNILSVGMAGNCYYASNESRPDSTPQYAALYFYFEASAISSYPYGTNKDTTYLVQPCRRF